MGTDVDFASELKKNKLVCTPFEQPLNELDGVTETTGRTNPEFFMQLIHLLEQRFANRQGNENGPVAMVIQLDNNQRIIIAFSNQERNRNPEPARERSVQQMMREILEDGNDRIQDEGMDEIIMPQIPQRMRQASQHQREQIRQMNGLVPQVEYEEGDWDLSQQIHQRQPHDNAQIQRNDQDQRQEAIQRQSESNLEELKHQQTIQQEQQQQKKSEQPQNNHHQIEHQQEFSPNPESKQDPQPKQRTQIEQTKNLASFGTQNPLEQTMERINQNSLQRFHRQDYDQIEEVTCWRAFVRMFTRMFSN